MARMMFSSFKKFARHLRWPLLLFPSLVFAAVDPVEPSAGPAFPLVANGRAAPICIPADAPTVVRIAAKDLAEDIGRVTGVRPEVRTSAPAHGPRVQLTLSAAAGDHWETFRLSATAEVLTVQGSDKRGLAFGIYDVSRRIGVSPWYWWADVPAVKRQELHLSVGTGPVESPAVRYRGIFLNDEGWGLEPWASKTHEPDVGNLGPKTYARIFELLLRLRANAIWPAMHPNTTPFHQVPGNAKVADDYAIVLGSSHAEPMLRNNVGEWKENSKHYNYITHPKLVLDYWEKRVAERTSGESLFTIGMRGIHDSAIVGPKNQRERIDTLHKIFADQRSLLARHLGKGDPSKVPQIFCPYKEVLSDYQAGLKVPADVTLVWPDDNFGYIRHFPTAEERLRPGGSGVYYHVSYLGSPLSWLWFDSLSPALVWSEMNRAFEHGASRFWVVNVGDMKGHELSTEWFLELAWHAGRYGPASGGEFLRRTASRDFGAAHGEAVAALWTRHQELATARKPEHLQWHLFGEPEQPSEMTTPEIKQRLAAYDRLAADAAAQVSKLPAATRDAAFQLISYPIDCARAANLRYFQLELLRRGDPSGDLKSAQAADRAIADLTRRYNEEISGGKWRGIMTESGLSKSAWQRFQPTSFATQVKSLTTPPAPEKPAEAHPEPTPAAGSHFVERDGVVSMHAGHFTASEDVGGGGWRVVPGLGRTGSAVTVLPSTLKGAPTLSYRFQVTTGGPATLHLRLLPTHPIDNGNQLRIAYAIDSAKPVTVSARDYDPKTNEWKMRVMANATPIEAKLPQDLKPGWHTLRLVAVDAGVVVDKIVIDLGGLRPSYDGPPETRAAE
jgi:hypothetical protein